MLTIEPSGAVLGATVRGLDLNDPLGERDFGQILHRAIADYGPDEIRLIRRCQVMATRVFDPEFLRPARELAAELAH